MKDRGFNVGFVGVGQGGNKLADCMATDFKSIAINTARQDLNSLKNILKDSRIHTKINDAGGAGKDIQLGEKAIIQYEDEILNNLRITFEDCDYVFICAGLGGGSGTLGSIQISRILAKMGQKHGFLITLPKKSEGTYEQINASVGIDMIEKARKRFPKTLRSIILIDNEKLVNRILENPEVKYEEVWKKSNETIKNSFIRLYEFSQESGEDNFDTTDYKKLFNLRGYIIFGSGSVSLEDTSEDVLAKEIRKLWQNEVYISGDDKSAKGIAVVLNRPRGVHSQDGRKINKLYTEIKKYFGSIHFADGIYEIESKSNMFDKMLSSFNFNNKKEKLVEVYTMLTGLSFPDEKINKLYRRAEEEGKGLQGKKEKSKKESSFDSNILSNIIDENPEPEIEDFSMFDEEDSVLDWSKIE